MSCYILALLHSNLVVSPDDTNKVASGTTTILLVGESQGHYMKHNQSFHFLVLSSKANSSIKSERSSYGASVFNGK